MRKQKNNQMSNQEMTHFLERPFPHNLEYEKLLLAQIMQDNWKLTEIASKLVSDDFYLTMHRQVFNAMLKLAEGDFEINELSIGERLKQQGELERCGGIAQITNLTYGVPRIDKLGDYLDVVKGYSAQRALIKTMLHEIAVIQESAGGPAKVLEQVHSRLLQAVSSSQLNYDAVKTPKQTTASVLMMMEKWRKGEFTAIPTGIPEIDAKLRFGGLNPQDLIYIAARTSVGKTAFALQIARYVARNVGPVLFITREMTKEKLWLRLAAAEAQIDGYKFGPEMFEDGNADACIDAVRSLETLNIHIEDTTNSLPQTCMTIEEYAKKGFVLTIVDYLQLVSSGLSFGEVTREQEVATISKSLKTTAKRSNQAVIALSQLKRLGNREKPQLDDLKESGQQEQDADVVAMLYGKKKDKAKGLPVQRVGIYFPKQRDGLAEWEVTADFHKQHQTFWTEAMYAARPRPQDDIEF